MIRCGATKEQPCGKVICCYTCTEKCADRCEEADALNCADAEDVGELVNLEKQVPEVIKAISDICTQKKVLDEQEKQMKQKLQEAMEQYGVKSFDNDVIKVTYVAPTVRNTLDSAKLKKELPDIAEKYTKTSNVSASVRISVK